MLINKDFLTWLLIGWQLAASQSEAMLENSSFLLIQAQYVIV